MPFKKRKPTNTSSTKDQLVRLNKYLSNAGICNRREADQLIKQGLVKVNGKIVTEMGHKVLLNDKVEVEGKQVYAGEKIFVLLNKPKGFTCKTVFDKNEKLASQLVKKAFSNKINILNPIDSDDKGLLVLTNDVYFAEEVIKIGNHFNAIYKVELNKPIVDEDLDVIKIKCKDFKLHKISVIDESRRILGIDISINSNYSIKAIFNKFNYKVESLDRVMYWKLTKKNIARGQWRYLTGKEIEQLRKLTAPR